MLKCDIINNNIVYVLRSHLQNSCRFTLVCNIFLTCQFFSRLHYYITHCLNTQITLSADNIRRVHVLTHKAPH